MAHRDYVIELPNEILCHIISKMTLKEAVRTSILSKAWRSLWTYHSYLLFDSINILGKEIYSNSMQCPLDEPQRQLQRHQFVEKVDHVMRQRDIGPKIYAFAIRFHLGKEFTSHMSKWIRCAVAKGVENINVDLSEWCSFKVDYAPLAEFERYTFFPCALLISPDKLCSIKHLQLAFCNLGSLPSSSNFTSLTTLELRDVNITDHQLENFLSASLCLETLNAHLCSHLVELKVSYLQPQLKILTIRNCFRLKSIEVKAMNLARLEYTGQLISFSFEKVPQLAQVFLSFNANGRQDGVTYALTRLANDIPYMKALNLHCILAIKTVKLPDEVSVFANVQELILTIFPFHDDDKFHWASYVLKAFPLLRNLQLNLFSPSYIRKSKDSKRVLPVCFHRFLSILEVNGFCGNQHETELLMFLLDNLVKLEVLVVSPRQKTYKGFGHWDFEEAGALHKMKPEIVEWFCKNLPPGVQLNIV